MTFYIPLRFDLMSTYLQAAVDKAHAASQGVVWRCQRRSLAAVWLDIVLCALHHQCICVVNSIWSHCQDVTVHKRPPFNVTQPSVNTKK
ncbi:hypothetical protein GDO81_021192 [Engystomops pustulosus]|uniref:Secreted protein n=1 Tax=Engystomops pustulosus TaxID=76066 RepID=A0AAV6YTU0_ENGPU|nr:hypothetical protein GDO81_021192 [Engystomops pustulosus]